jgi:hypothetical protein
MFLLKVDNAFKSEQIFAILISNVKLLYKFKLVSSQRTWEFYFKIEIGQVKYTLAGTYE